MSMCFSLVAQVCGAVAPSVCARAHIRAALGRTQCGAMGAGAIRNELLAAMPRKAYEALAPALAPVTLVFGEVLYRPGEAIAHVYFPCESMVSLLVPVANHLDVEVGMVGREGMVGASLGLGIARSPVKA